MYGLVENILFRIVKLIVDSYRLDIENLMLFSARLASPNQDIITFFAVLPKMFHFSYELSYSEDQTYIELDLCARHVKLSAKV